MSCGPRIGELCGSCLQLAGGLQAGNQQLLVAAVPQGGPRRNLPLNGIH